MGKSTVSLGVAVLLLLVSANALSATRYISDELSVNMRRGPSTSYAITDLVKSGTRVETLDKDNGWTQIRTPGGQVGFVLTRLLSSQPAARDRLKEVEAKLGKLKKENKELRAELSKALHGSKKLGKLKRELVDENKKLKNKLDEIKRVSSNALQLKKQNKEYREKLLALNTRLDRLQAENKALRSRRQGMKIGALILIGGVILGLILPMFRRRKKGNWDSL